MENVILDTGLNLFYIYTFYVKMYNLFQKGISVRVIYFLIFCQHVFCSVLYERC